MFSKMFAKFIISISISRYVDIIVFGQEYLLIVFADFEPSSFNVQKMLKISIRYGHFNRNPLFMYFLLLFCRRFWVVWRVSMTVG